jgi:hypothetical protein
MRTSKGYRVSIMFMNISRGERIDFNQQAMQKNDIQTVGTKRSIAEQDDFHRADFFVIHADVTTCMS